MLNAECEMLNAQGDRADRERWAKNSHMGIGSLPHSAFRIPHSAFSSRRRRGTILVTAIWCCIALTSIVLLMARSSKVELSGAANRVAAVQTAALVRGAEQYVLALVDSAGGDPTVIIDSASQDPMVPMAIGDGYFWLVKPDPDNEELTAYGLTDEAAKQNLNSMSINELMKLPGMTTDFADAILDWHDADSNVTDQGAEDDYYMGPSMAQPYHAKNDRIETFEELRLVKGVTDEILWGSDKNHDGIIDPRELRDEGTAGLFNGSNGAQRGIAPFVTVYTIEANSATGKVNVNDTQNPNALRDLLTKSLKGGASRTNDILAISGRARPFVSVFDFCFKAGMTVEEVKAVYAKLTTTTATTIQGRVNVLTAPREVLAALPGMESQDVDNLLNKRASATSGDLSWVYDALGPAKAALVGAWITDKSYQYSADIVVMSGNGRSFRRVRIVVDGRAAPAKILFRKDVTDLGLPQDLEDPRAALQQGQQLQTSAGSTGGSF